MSGRASGFAFDSSFWQSGFLHGSGHQRFAESFYLIGDLVEECGSFLAALLAVNEGSTQGVAAKKSGLKVGQVRYLMTLFKKDGMNLFPENVLATEKTTKPEKKKAPAKKETTKEKKPEKKRLFRWPVINFDLRQPADRSRFALGCLGALII